jgi:hypothetical protein
MTAVGADYRAALAAAGVGYRPIWANRWEPMTQNWLMVNFNGTGTSFAAHVRQAPDTGGSPLATMTVAVGTITTTTWGALLASGVIKSIPEGFGSLTAVTTTAITLTMSDAVMAALPAAPELGHNMILYWDLKRTSAPKRVVVAGEFTVVGGVTNV